MIEIENKNYIDVTEEWLNNKKHKGVITNAKSVTLNNKRYLVNSQNKINHKNQEKYIAKLIVKTFGGELEYLPDIGEDAKVRCGDYLYKNEIWDLKELGVNVQSKTRAVDNILKSAKGQANNFILDITECKLDRSNIINQIEKIYITKNRQWIDKIIVFDNDKLLKVYQRKNKRG